MISDQTKSEYIGVLLRELERLQLELPHVKDMAKQSKLMNEHYTQKELMITSQISQVKKEIEKARNNEFGMIPEGDNRITRIDSKITEANDEIHEVAEDIDSLERKAGLTEDSVERMALLAEMRSKEKRLRQLQRKNVKFSNRQRSILLRKNKKESLKRRVLAEQEARVAMSEMKAADLDRKQTDIDDEKFLNALVVEKVLDVRRRANEWKASFDRKVLDNMRNSKFVGIKGARAMAIAKTAGQRLRDRINPSLSELSKMIRPEEKSNENKVAVVK